MWENVFHAINSNVWVLNLVMAFIFLLLIGLVNIHPPKRLKGLFLDDIRKASDVVWVQYPPNIGWTVVRNVEDFIRLACANKYDVMSLDHDLGLDENGGLRLSGMDAVKQLVELHMDEKVEHMPYMVFFHSKNPDGKKNMERYWKQYKFLAGF